jgi:hypothetical protein
MPGSTRLLQEFRMDPTTYALVIGVAVLGLLVAWGTRHRRDDALDPIRLGPAWEPNDGDGPASPTGPDPRVEVLQQRTGCDADTVANVLSGWDEHLAVLGLLSLPASHRYRVYDPYDRPVMVQGSDNRPVTDPGRVARDVARRTPTAELDARAVLDALLGDPETDLRGPEIDQRS